MVIQSLMTKFYQQLIILKPSVVIIPGLAFGLNNELQKIGDIVLSEVVTPYSIEGGPDFNINADSYYYADEILLDRFSNSTWKFYLGRGRYSNIHTGNLVSSKNYPPNLNYRNKLNNCFDNALAGELEGCGLSHVLKEKGIKFITVKSICEWLDTEKNIGVKRKSAKAAISICLKVFSQQTVFDAIGVKALDQDAVDEQDKYDFVNAEVGTPLWGLNILRSTTLSKLIEDLKENNHADYIESEMLEPIKDSIDLLKDSAQPFVNYSFADNKINNDEHLLLRSIFDDLDAFFNKVEEWSMVKGNNQKSCDKREDIVVQLKKIRKGIAYKVRENNYPLVRVFKGEPIFDEIMNKLEDMCNEYPDLFPKLGSATRKYEKKKNTYNLIG